MTKRQQNQYRLSILQGKKDLSSLERYEMYLRTKGLI